MGTLSNMLSSFSGIWSFIVAVLVLAVLVLVHELGHFLSARMVGIRVDEFAVGMGPKLFGIQGKTTLYSLRLIPLGGYCRYRGEDEEVEDADAFNKQPVWKRFFSVICGPFMNIAVAFIILLIMVSAVGLPTVVPKVDSVIDGSAAMEAGMLAGDRIVSVNGEPVESVEQLTGIIKSHPDRTLNLGLENGGETREISVTPRLQENGSVAIGIYFGNESVRYPLSKALEISFVTIGELIKEMYGFLRDLIFRQEGVGDISGPVGIVVTISDTARRGGFDLMFLMAFISVNLAVMNLLPIPALDGSRLIFLIIEGIRRKPFNREREALVHLVGLGALMLLIVFVTYKDIIRLFQF